MMSPIIMGIAFLIVLIVVLTIYFWLSDYFSLRSTMEFIPGPKSLPFIGHSWKIAAIPEEDRFEWLNDVCFKYDLGMVVIWLGMTPFVNIRKPKQIEIILRSNMFTTKSKIYGILESWLGKGVFTANGNKWFIHRHVIRSGFETEILDDYVEMINKKTIILLKQIDAKTRGNTKTGVNIFSLAVKYAFDVTCNVAMGIDMDTLRKSDNMYTRAINIFCQTATERYMYPWVTSDFSFYKKKIGKKMLKVVKILHDFSAGILKQKQAERKDKSIDEKSKTFLDHILNKNENFQYPLKFEELRDELDTFLFVGCNTISSAITWAIFALGNEPKIQLKVLEELQDVIGDEEDEKPITIEQLRRLHYLDRVLKEVLRLYPSVPIIGRSMDNHAVIDNYFIPKGTNVNIQIYQLHHDPEIWNDPELFDPDRFLPNNDQRHRYAYIPFSSGPRRCLADNLAVIEIKIAILSILKKWRVSSMLKPNEIKMTSSFSLKPFDNRLEIFFTPINKY